MGVPSEKLGMRILVVEDDLVDRKQMERLLKAGSLSIGKIVHADCLQACLDLVHNEESDAVLLDLNLPDSNGLDTVAKIHQADPTVPVIVVTGEGGEEVGLEAAAHGAQDYLVKGEFDARMLTRVIHYACERRRQQEATHLTQFSVDSAADAIFWVQQDSSFRYVNEAVSRLLGYSREELLAMRVVDINPAHSPEVWRAFWEELRQQRSLTFEAVFRAKDGRSIPTEVTANYLEFGGQAYDCAFVRDISDRKKAEQAVHTSENNYRQLFERSNDAIVIADPETRMFVDCNKKAEDMSGYSRQELLSMRADQFHPEDKVNETMEAFEKQAAGMRVAVESEILTKSKERVAVSINSAVVEIDGKPRLMGVFRDVTERMRAEAELEFRNTLLSTQQEASMEGILVVDEKGKILSFNQRFVDMWGIPPEAIAARSDELALKSVLDKLVNPQEFLQKVDYLYGNPNETSRDEIDLKEGRTFDRYSAPMIGPGQKYYGRVWYFREITERKRVENALRESELRLRVILDSILTGVLIIDARTHLILDVNPMGQKILGMPRAEIVGHPCHRYVCPAEQGRCPVTDLDQTVDLAERVALRSDGTLVEILKSVSRVTIQGQECLVESFVDITDRREAERVIRQANEQLEKANRELKDMQVQIVQSEKLASIGQLAAGVAHEMNTPVGFVASNFQTLGQYMNKLLDLLHLYEALGEAVEDGPKEERLQIVKRIRQVRKDLKIDFLLGDIEGLLGDSREGLERITSIIQNLRDFSRIDQAEEFAEYNLNDGLKATLVVAQNEIKDDAEVRLELGDVPPVPCRAGQINQAFLNILINAVQAIRSQGRQDKGTITIRTYRSDDEVVCEIADDGPGIPAEIVPKIFDPFFTTKPVGKGTGLGLSISYDIVVNKHQGQIGVASTVGQGTTFTIKLPMKQMQVQAEQVSAGGLTHE